MQQIEPLDDRVVIKQLSGEGVTKGGIVIPETAREKSQQGEVVAVGPGRRLDSGERAKLAVEVGDTVLYAKYAGSEIKVNDEERLVLREHDILCVVRET